MFRSLLTSLIRKLDHLFSRSTSPATIQQYRGKKGEDLAARYLKQNTSYSILLRNWSDGRHEIDLICRDGDTLVFVEVRARSVSAKVSGYASINAAKRRSLRRAAFSYMSSLPQRPRTYRYDAIEIGLKDDEADHIRLYRNIRVF